MAVRGGCLPKLHHKTTKAGTKKRSKLCHPVRICGPFCRLCVSICGRSCAYHCKHKRERVKPRPNLPRLCLCVPLFCVVCVFVCLSVLRLSVCLCVCLSVCVCSVCVCVSVCVFVVCVCCLFCFLLCGRVYCLPVVCCLPLSSVRTDTKKAGFLPRSLSVCLWLLVRVCERVPQSVIFVTCWDACNISASTQTLKFCGSAILYKSVNKLYYCSNCRG